MERDINSRDGEEDRSLGILDSNGVQTDAYTGDSIDTLNAAKWQLPRQDRQLTG